MTNPYFPAKYLQDLGAFYQGKAIPLHGSFWMLCGMTAGNLYESNNIKNFYSPPDFLCCLYFLNLINQGIYTYYPECHGYWRVSCAPFVDSRGCSYGHGGWSSNPSSILRFAKDPSYIPRATPIEISPDQLEQYAEYFFSKYLPSIFETYPRNIFSSNDLFKHLQDDLDCSEVRQYSGL